MSQTPTLSEITPAHLAAVSKVAVDGPLSAFDTECRITSYCRGRIYLKCTNFQTNVDEIGDAEGWSG
jgi:hypothetical protein